MRIDHIVLVVKDIENTCSFYSRILGMRVIKVRGGGRELQFGDQKIKLYKEGEGPGQKALNALPGSLDICFVSSISLKHLADHIRSLGVEIIEGPVRRNGAMGPIESIYLRDPDGNLVEVANYLSEGLQTAY
jgi:catechol 2,3-dioxygenase-like lactoylglutathione lyase family enzyme